MNEITLKTANTAGTLLKGLQVLEAFDAGHRELSLTEVVSLTGLEISGARRLLFTFVTAGYLDQDARTRRYRLSAKVLRWSVAFLGADPLVSCAYPILEHISRDTGCQFELSVLRETTCVLLLSMPGEKGKLSFVDGPSTGVREPAFCSSTGIAILSRLPKRTVFDLLSASPRKKLTKHTVTNIDRVMAFVSDAHERGYSITDRSCHPRAISIGAPIVDYTGQPAAAIAVSLESGDYSLAAAEREFSQIVVKTAQSISHAYQRAT
jgi:DNA-binding IclR family transcriptional regulator